MSGTSEIEIGCVTDTLGLILMARIVHEEWPDAQLAAVLRPDRGALPAHRRDPRARHEHNHRHLQGRYSFTATKRSGACRGHGGVQSWGSAAATSPVSTSPQPGAQPEGKTSQRAGTIPGGAGRVWVNTSSKVYHCPGTRWYGKTKHGSYMSEAQAKEQGARPDHGKVCTS